MCANISRPIYYLNQQLIQVTGSGYRYQTPAKQVGGSGGRGGAVGSFVSGAGRLVPLTDSSVFLGDTGVFGGGR